MKGYMCLICTIEINRSLRGNKEVLKGTDPDRSFGILQVP